MVALKIAAALILGFILGAACIWHYIPTAGTIIVDTKNADKDVYRLEVNNFMIFHDPRKRTVKMFIENNDFEEK